MCGLPHSDIVILGLIQATTSPALHFPGSNNSTNTARNTLHTFDDYTLVIKGGISVLVNFGFSIAPTPPKLPPEAAKVPSC